MKVMFEILTIYLSFLSRMEFSPKGGEKNSQNGWPVRKKLGISFQD